MLFGICEWCLPRRGTDGLRFAAAAGLDGVEIEYADDLAAKELRRAADDLGLLLPTMGVNLFCDRSYVDAGTTDFFTETMKKALDFCAVLGAKTLQLPAFFASEIDSRAKLEQFAAHLALGAELAKPYGVAVATENALDLEENQYVQRVVGEDFRFYFDTMNLPWMKGISHDELLSAMPICEVHAKDGVWKDGFSYRPLGQGDTDFFCTAKALKKLGYTGFVHLENEYAKAFSPSLGSVEADIHRDLETLKDTFLR